MSKIKNDIFWILKWFFYQIKMVNTFIVRRCGCESDGVCRECHSLPSVDYTLSASHLDTSRLRKQCLEAYQILMILYHLRFLSHEMGIPLEEIDETLPITENIHIFFRNIDRIKTIRRQYLAQPYRYFRKKGEDTFTKVPKDQLPLKLYSSIKYYFEGDVCLVFTNKSLTTPTVNHTPLDKERHAKFSKRMKCYFIHSKNVCMVNDTLITLGFSQHAIIKMWIGYESSLRDYLSSHLSVLQSRNGKMTLPTPDYTYTPPDKIIHPWWITHTPCVMMSHRASLLRKEIAKEEREWYVLDNLFTSPALKEWMCYGYVWSGTIPLSKALDISSPSITPSLHPSIFADIQVYNTDVNVTQSLIKKFYGIHTSSTVEWDGTFSESTPKRLRIQ